MTGLRLAPASKNSLQCEHPFAGPIIVSLPGAPRVIDQAPANPLSSVRYLAFRRRVRDECGAGWLTAMRRDVLNAIAALADDDGVCVATNAKIAVDAQGTVSTVQRATRDAVARGLLVKTPQYEMVNGRRQQIANRYQLLVPDEPVKPKPKIRKPRRSAGCQPDAPRKKKVSLRRTERRIAAPDLLLAHRKRVEAALAERHRSPLTK